MSLNLAFFGLQQKPFNPTPDPAFLYASPGHQEALAHLLYGVQEHKGFILLTGEVGTGKTTLLRTLLSRLDGNTASAFVFDTTLPFEGLLEYMLEDFGVAKPGESHAQRLFALNNFLIERQRAGQNTVLVLDEAQNLDVRALEQIRLLSNFETHTEKLLQIVLAGQPELLDTLDRPELRQLKQRIGIVCTIPPMTSSGARNYIRTRLRLAGARDLGIFTEEALARISAHSSGIPRVVNTLCDHCLLIGYADQTRRIDGDIVEQALSYFHGGTKARPVRRVRSISSVARRRARRRMGPLGWGVLGTSAAVVAAVIALAFVHPELLSQAVDLSTSQLSGITRTVRTLIGR